MISSHKIDDLRTPVKVRALKFITDAKLAGIDVIVTCTYRDEEAQHALFEQGRTKPGHIVTNADAGDSMHQWRVAFDFVPVLHGKPLWSDEGKAAEIWERLGQIGEDCGLKWAGRWKGKFHELAHMQYTGGLSLAELRAGKELPSDVAMPMKEALT